MDRMTGAPIISVVIPTCNRAELLEATLHSLAEQSIAIDQYEVLVIDDGSVDETPEICRRFHSRLQLRYHRVPKVGISAAKNLGIFASRGAVLLFFDDDDLADCDLLLEHIRAHQRHPEEHVAVLGYTTWAPALPISEVMHYITDVGHIMFGYPALRDGEMLDWTKFWGGRTSCKRAFLTRHGVFNQSLPGAEDDELGFRLARHGLKVLFHRSARSYMNRPFTYDQFCGRCEAIGVCRILFSRIHPEPEIPDHYGLDDAEVKWRRARVLLDAQVRRVHELEDLLGVQQCEEEREHLRSELYSLYKATFEAFFLKGMNKAMETAEVRESAPAGARG